MLKIFKIICFKLWKVTKFHFWVHCFTVINKSVTHLSTFSTSFQHTLCKCLYLYIMLFLTQMNKKYLILKGISLWKRELLSFFFYWFCLFPCPYMRKTAVLFLWNLSLMKSYITIKLPRIMITPMRLKSGTGLRYSV